MVNTGTVLPISRELSGGLVVEAREGVWMQVGRERGFFNVLRPSCKLYGVGCERKCRDVFVFAHCEFL